MAQRGPRRARPGTRRVDEGLHLGGHGGRRWHQPHRAHGSGRRGLPRRLPAHGGRGERGHRWRLRRGSHRGHGQRLPWPMFNLSPMAIDARARLVEGRKPLSMVEAAAEGAFDVALFVGYHARAGHPRAASSPTRLSATLDPRRTTHRRSTASTGCTWGRWACPWGW
ncbi:MAG: M55 family metallopeptidase [Chloroflexota bacterium]